VVVTGRLPALEAQRKTHDFLLFWGGGGRWKYTGFPNVATGLVVVDTPVREVLALCGDGVVRVFGDDGESVEVVDPSDDGPSSLQWLLDLRKIGNSVYTCGMLRQVYRRASPDRWLRFDSGLRTGETTGLKSIHGFSEKEIYAVGFRGENWTYDGKAWTQEPSITDLKLEKVLCARDGQVYICGARGMIIKGRSGRWQVVEQDLTTETFWDMTEFGNSIFLSTLNGLFRLGPDGRLRQVDMQLPHPTTTSRVDADDEVLWSVGRDHLVVYDGENWNEVEGPQSSPHDSRMQD
jgi:hypothetical protein